jgi:hypothetical protein
MRLEGGDKAIESGTRVGGHGMTVAAPEAQWQPHAGATTGGESTVPMHHYPGLDAASSRRRAGPEYEVRVLTIPPTSTRGEVLRLLTDEAEYGRWELARTRVYVGGVQRVWLRRPIIRVRSTL